MIGFGYGLLVVMRQVAGLIAIDIEDFTHGVTAPVILISGPVSIG